MSNKKDPRLDWVYAKVAAAFCLRTTDPVTDYVTKSGKKPMIEAFLGAEGPRKLLWYYQGKETVHEGKVRYIGSPQLYLTDGDSVGLGGRCAYFLRMSTGKALTNTNIADEIVAGEIEGSLLLALEEHLNNVMLPCAEQRQEWGEITRAATTPATVAGARAPRPQPVQTFLDEAQQFRRTLSEAVTCVSGNVRLNMPDPALKIDARPQGLMRAANDQRVVKQCEEVLDGWCRQVEQLLAESEQVRQEADDVGPHAELEYWKNRMARFNSITDQLKQQDCKSILAILTSAKSRVLKQWKTLDMSITDAANEAKDNVKYLYTLERFLEPLYRHDPVQMLESIPGLINAIQMMHSIARYYNTSEHMTALFVKITNQMISCCKDYLLRDNGVEVDIWEQKRVSLIAKLRACVDLNAAYQGTYRATKQKLQATPREKQFDFSETYIFGKFDLFTKRLQKLMDMFSTIHQFSSLEHATVDGMEPILKRFTEIVDTMQRKPYDLLDHRRADFASDYVEFLSKIMELETNVQEFINHCFNQVTDTQRALDLLQSLKQVLQRENLRNELDTKYRVIFASYGRDLEMVRRQYEKFKQEPPVQRNIPPVAGNIMWARQLLRRIETPMLMFQEHPMILGTPEAKRIIRTYNKLASALIQFETLWHHGWTSAVDAATTGLQATLLVRHPVTKRLYVNFDRGVLQLIVEAKWMARMELEIPERAKFVVAQEAKLKELKDELSHMLVEHHRVLTRKVSPVLRRLMRPHVEELNRRLEPGVATLTWTSINVTGYLHSVHHQLAKLEELADQSNDILTCRIERNIAAVLSVQLLRLPENTENSATVVEMVAQHATSRAKVLAARSRAVEVAVNDLINTITASNTREQNAEMAQDIRNLRGHFRRLTYEGLLKSVKLSLAHLKRRLGAGSVGMLINQVLGSGSGPFFKVELELSIPDVVMKPSLDEVQKSLNLIAVELLKSIKQVDAWGQDHLRPEERQNWFDDVAKNKEVVKSVLLLTGSISGLKQGVFHHLETFRNYAYLWKDNKADAFKQFMAANPDIDAFENELQRFEKIEHEIAALGQCHNIGALSLDCSSLKYSLQSETAGWKQQYGATLNKKSKQDMDALLAYMEETQMKLQRPVNDLDDVRQTMEVLGSLRDMENEIDLRISPIEETYQLLTKYNVRVSREEVESVDSLRWRWKKLKVTASKTQDHLIKLQPGFKRDLIKSVKVFKSDVVTFHRDYQANGPMVSGLKPRVAIDRLKTFNRAFEERERKWVTYSVGQQLFGMEVTQYPELEQLRKELKLLSSLYELYSDVIATINGYEDILWSELCFDDITNEITDFQNRCRRLPKAMRDWEAYVELKKTIDDFCELMPLLSLLSNRAIRPRHWQQIMTMTKHTFKLDADSFKLKHLLEAPLLTFKETIEDICNAAVKEADIETKLGAIQDDWTDQVFTFATFKNRGELTLKGSETQEIVTLMEDSLMALNSLMSNRYNAPFRSEIQLWVQKLSTASEVIEQWLQVQALWVYLEAVFAGGDIARQLPKEAKRFGNIDKSWVKIMGTAHDNPNVINCCYADEILRNLLPHLTEQLELCQKSLSGYLEAKRQVFPRFYFVSDPVLLEILGQSSDPHTIVPHLNSVFDNISVVEFDKAHYNRIIGMESSEGQYVPLSKPVVADGGVEIWLNDMVKHMQMSVKDIVRIAAQKVHDSPTEEFVKNYPAQVALLGIQLQWTSLCEDALSKARNERGIMQATNRRIGEILRILVDMTTQPLSKLERTNIETLITIQVHQKDVFDSLVRAHIKSPVDFEWQKQTRFYWRPDKDDCIVSITDVDFTYQYEYLGCTDRLVITPLTDRCYITLAQAIGMCLGGAPAGPAGTGKTETVKDMGKALGKFVVVFNCSDQMDFRGLGKIYKGLAMSGLWGDFDEFNRIELPVLSVAAQQIACVLQAKRERKTEFVFTDGDVVSLNPNFALFITMNPGYAGRQELPENMKVQFRSVAMMVPDRQIIMRVKLASQGFQENQILSQKFFILYALCEEQLSKQRHYDFGLRNILSVLRTCGFVKRANPNDSEAMIMMRVLRDMNLSKLVDEDEPLFRSLISDLFPGLNVGKASFPDLDAAIREEVEKAGLINHPDWALKIIQLYESAKVRHGIMVLGPSGAGKTTCIHTLMKAMTVCEVPHREIRMNPKAITAPQMFGRLDVATNDWTDGIFSALWRKASKKNKNGKDENIWLTLDGPVDAIWIENLNTVLDDNKSLTLANSDRLPMPPNLKLIFEVSSLENASPATVSRAGMIYMSNNSLGWKPVLEAWLKKVNQKQSDELQALFHAHAAAVFAFVRDYTEPKMLLSEVHQITTWLNLLNGLMALEGEDAPPVTGQKLERLFVFGCVWSLGATLETADRMKLHEFLRDTAKMALPDIDNAADTVFEYVVSTSGDWEHWSSRVPDYQYPMDSIPPFASILVPTVDSVRTVYLMKLIAAQKKAVLLIGGPGTAKTATIQQYIGGLDTEVMASKTINFSSATTPNIFQRTIEGVVEKRIGNTFGPPGGKSMAVFIDDINMPEINEWGDQITNEIVRQLINERGFYSLDKPGEWTQIVDMQFLAAMCHPGGGRNNIPERLMRHFAIFNCTIPSEASINRIFGTILKGYFIPERGFAEDVHSFVDNLVPMTLNLWQTTRAKMLPTPAKFHYVFNLRDLSRIFEGLLLAEAEVVQNVPLLLKLWRHEACRVIPDKFVNAEDVAWFTKALSTVVEDRCADNPEYIEAVAEPTWWVDFMREPEEIDDPDVEAIVPKVYEPVTLAECRARLELFQTQFNEENKGQKMDLVLFDDAIKHMVKIARILHMPRGNALLVGVGGSGKQSLTRLASFIAGYETYQITITRGYNENNLLDDLRYMYKQTGAVGKGVTFIFTDNEIKDEGFLEHINNILTSGEVANLFPRDEMDMILGDLRPVFKREMKASGRQTVDTNENLYRYFIDRVRTNLHVVLCFSPVGEKFRSRSLKFPGLISGCTIDWFTPWPQDALNAVAEKFLNDFEIACTPETKHNLVRHMGYVHDAVTLTTHKYFSKFRRHTYVTPKSFLSFVNAYRRLYLEKRNHIGILAERMTKGLTKLVEAGEDVAKLRVDLIEKEKQLEKAQKAASEFLVEITAKTAEAEKKKSEVLVVKEELAKKAAEIQKEKDLAEKDLEAAKPALEQAKAALNAIKPADISTLKRLAKPPNLIKRLMDGVLILRRFPLGPVKQDPDMGDRKLIMASWESSGKMLTDSNFLTALLGFPKETINDETCELLEPYLRMEDFVTEVARKASGNVAGLCSWIRAMVTYHQVSKDVAPKVEALHVAEGSLKVALRSLRMAEEELEAKQKVLNKMQDEYDKAMQEKKRLQDDADTCRRRLSAAAALIDGLAGEKDRWTQQSKEFNDTINRLVGDVAIACAFLSYCGPFNQEFRNELMFELWVKDLMKNGIPFSADLNITKFLTDDATIGEWNIQGLPTDELSIQNGIIVTSATRYPLLIDPQGQGKSWIRCREEPNGLRATTMSDKNFRSTLEECLSFGQPMLLEDVEEELDPVLDPVLEKNFIRSGRSLKVKLGDKEVDVCDGFRLYMTTKLANPHYSPEVSAKTSIIDMTVTMKGLEDQLLGRVILKEKAELEKQLQKLKEEVNYHKRKIKQLEDDLLFRLTSTEGNLLDDSTLIEVLANTKLTSQEVTEKLAVSTETEKKINTAREEFRPVATRGSILYFLIAEMSLVNEMYQTSLAQFLKLFDGSMEHADPSPITSKRIGNIISYATYSVYTYVARGLFENHKLLFVLQLALKIEQRAGTIDPAEAAALIKGGAALDLNTVRKKPFAWIPDTTWLNLVALSELPTFDTVLFNIEHSEARWKAWYELEAPEQGELPDGLDAKLDTFHKLLLVRSWCPDRTMLSATGYIIEALGAQFVEALPLDLEATAWEADCRTPLVCLLSVGADPSAQIMAVAKKNKVEIRDISMGQGQEVHARRLIQQGMATGGWVLLQNCHLGLKFLDEVVETIRTTEEIHERFRVWITTEPVNKFPINLLQMSIKVTNEPPQGVKAGLKRTYNWVSQDMLDAIDRPQWKTLLYVMCFLHSIVQERRKFGPLGWNIPYEFNSSDLAASVQFLQNHLYELDAKKGISWGTVRYMICEVQYGGRITDDYDRRLMNAYGTGWMNDGVFNSKFEFYKGYNVPDARDINGYREFINTLPLTDTPEIFGLHPNADIAYRTQQASDILGTILACQPKDSGAGGGETREDAVLRIVNDLLGKLPADFVAKTVRSRIKALGSTMPLNVFLSQEITRFQRVLSLVRKTLEDLRLAIAGTIIMSSNLQDGLNSLYDARVPAAWEKISWPSATLGFWFTDLLGRAEQYGKWLMERRPNCFWLTGFFNPQGFLTAMRQEVARNHSGWALDTVRLHTEVTKLEKDDVRQAPEEGVYIYGLFLDGARWDKKGGHVVDSRPKALFHSMPVIHVSAVNQGGAADPHMYVCPVYRTPRRTDLNYVFAVNLRTSEDPNVWVRRGVALLCSKV